MIYPYPLLGYKNLDEYSMLFDTLLVLLRFNKNIQVYHLNAKTLMRFNFITEEKISKNKMTIANINQIFTSQLFIHSLYTP